MLPKLSYAFFVSLLMLLVSCSRPLPDQMPDLGVKENELVFNKNIHFTAPKECNSFKSGDEICLQVMNLSDKTWNFNITKDVLIYAYENTNWVKISDGMMHLGATEITLEPKGKFPEDRQIFHVLPQIDNYPASLRIIIIFHQQIQGKEDQIEGAYIDVNIKPR